MLTFWWFTDLLKTPPYKYTKDSFLTSTSVWRHSNRNMIISVFPKSGSLLTKFLLIKYSFFDNILYFRWVCCAFYHTFFIFSSTITYTAYSCHCRITIIQYFLTFWNVCSLYPSVTISFLVFYVDEILMKVY